MTFLSFVSFVGLCWSLATHLNAYATLVVEIEVPTLIREAFLQPQYIGRLHTDFFERLGRQYALTDPPVSRKKALEDVRNIMYEYCDGVRFWVACRTRADEALHLAVKTIRNGDHNKRNHRNLTNNSSTPHSLSPLFHPLYPSNISPVVSAHLDQLFLTLDKVDDGNVLDVLKEIDDIANALVDHPDLHHPYHKFVAQAATNVASESLLLWHAVHQDPGHNLYGITFQEEKEEEPQRHLQLTTGIGPTYTSLISSFDLFGFFMMCPPVFLFSTALYFPLNLIPVPFVGAMISPFLMLVLVPIVLGHTFVTTAFSAVAWMSVGLLSPILPVLDDDDSDGEISG